jgi:hypothetical protein
LDIDESPTGLDLKHPSSALWLSPMRITIAIKPSLEAEYFKSSRDIFYLSELP